MKLMLCSLWLAATLVADEPVPTRVHLEPALGLRTPSSAICEVVRSALPSAVWIRAYPAAVGPRLTPTSCLEPDSADRFSVSGSGIVIAVVGNTLYVLTNNHVLEGMAGLCAEFSDGRRYPLRQTWTDSFSEVALVAFEIGADDPRPTPPPVRGFTSLRVGEAVVAIGNPLGQPFTVTSGIVSAVQRRPKELETALDCYTQVDCAINPGNSGGPLFDVAGQLIGINTAILGGERFVGIAEAIPADIAVDIANRMLADPRGRAFHGALGVVLVDRRGRPTVKEVAGTAPLLVDDVIEAIDGVAVNSSAETRVRIDASRPGRTISVRVVRSGSVVDLEATITDYPTAPRARRR